MKYILFDSDNGGILLSPDAKIVHSPKSKHKIIGWSKGCITTVFLSKRNDTIICWYDFQAVICYWICMILLKKRKIVCMNILLKDKPTRKNKIVAMLYKKMLKSANVIASVTSKEYGEHIKERLNIRKELFLLHDVYHDYYKYENEVQEKPNSVFCGGRNGRDWDFIIDVARATPRVEFHLVMPSNIHERYDDLPLNIIAKSNLTIEEFMKEMCSCSIVALPLDTEAPAGLIVFFQAAANYKYVITTDTMTTREYFSDGRGCLLPNNVQIWSKTIREKLNSTENNREASGKLLEFLRCECSEEKFSQGIEKMINSI